MSMRKLNLRKDPDCPICGENPTIHELIDYEQFCGVPVGVEYIEEQLGPEWEIEAGQLAERMSHDGQDLVLVDVREPHEAEIASIPGAKLIPLGELPARMHELDSADEIVLHCRSGARSATALRLLRDAGFTKLKNLEGGILAWSDEVDPSVVKY
jgi:rhodanese-related sulfurtransferase